ncbi:MAG: glycosyltransferase [Candidatus Hydrogenedentota bacterium]
MPGMEPLRLKVSDRLKAIMGYRKFAGAVPRMLVLQGRYWLDEACVRAANSLGWQVAEAPICMEGALPRADISRLFYTLAEFRPDFVLSVNLSGMDEDGVFARFFEDLALPCVTWFVDDPRTIMMGRTCYTHPYAVAFTWDAAYTDYLHACGFMAVHTLPLAADPALFNAPPSAANADHLPPAFVGNSMREPAAREWAWIAARPAVAQSVRDAFAAGRVDRRRFGEGLAAMLGADATAGFDAHERRHAEIYCFVEGTRRRRHALLAGLADVNVLARGDAGWREVTPHTGPPVNYTHELPDFYRDCAVNLNTTSIQMPHTVNQRVFDCPAAGGFLLTDNQADLAALFDMEREVATFHDLADCREKLAHYLAEPGLRREMAARARARVLGEHTYAHRLQQIAGLLRARYG